MLWKKDPFMLYVSRKVWMKKEVQRVKTKTSYRCATGINRYGYNVPSAAYVPIADARGQNFTVPVLSYNTHAEGHLINVI